MKSIAHLALALTPLALPACSSPDAENQETSEEAVAISAIKIDTTRSFAGTFEVFTDIGFVKYKFTVSNIDWAAKTAKWNTKVIAGDPNGVLDPVDLDAEIHIDNDGTGDFSIIAKETGYDAVELYAAGNELSVLYYGLYADKLKLTKVSKKATLGGA